MSIEVRLPQWGMSMHDGYVVRWLVAEGDAVTEGDDLVEIEAAKVTGIVPSPASGLVAEILVTADNEVAVGTVLAVLTDAL